MPSAKHERLYGFGKLKVRERKAPVLYQAVAPAPTKAEQMSPLEQERMAAEGGLINDRSGEATKKVQKRLGY